jgi:hypothetical protein
MTKYQNQIVEMKGQCIGDGAKDQDLKKKIVDIDGQSDSLKANLESFMRDKSI